MNADDVARYVQRAIAGMATTGVAKIVSIQGASCTIRWRDPDGTPETLIDEVHWLTSYTPVVGDNVRVIQDPGGGINILGKINT